MQAIFSIQLCSNGLGKSRDGEVAEGNGGGGISVAIMAANGL